MAFNLIFTNNISSSFFLFFLIIDLYFLIPEIIAKNFNSTTELAMSRGRPTKETKAGNETHPVTAKAKISNCSI